MQRDPLIVTVYKLVRSPAFAPDTGTFFVVDWDGYTFAPVVPEPLFVLETLIVTFTGKSPSLSNSTKTYPSPTSIIEAITVAPSVPPLILHCAVYAFALIVKPKIANNITNIFFIFFTYALRIFFCIWHAK